MEHRIDGRVNRSCRGPLLCGGVCYVKRTRFWGYSKRDADEDLVATLSASAPSCRQLCGRFPGLWTMDRPVAAVPDMLVAMAICRD
jgi:hypothetical protein